MPARSWILLVGLLALAGPGRLAAHSAPGSALLLDFQGDGIGAELRLPLSELEVAFRQPLEGQPATVVARFGPELVTYLRQHLQPRAPDGRPWTVAVIGLDVALSEQPVDLVARLRLQPPDGASARCLTLRSQVILHEVMNHFTVVSARSDWNQALLGGRPELLGTLHAYAPELTIDRTDGSVWRGFRTFLVLGGRHIAEGTDHLLFLLLLLLTAPVVAAGGTWAGPSGLRASGGKLLTIVTAFTVGHSLTLLVGSLGWLSVPARLVEVLIAVSILVSALHALRPWFPGREPLVAGGFGLIHGLAFATVLSEFQLGAWQLAAALLAFNLGLELMQLAVVAVAAPVLVFLGRNASYRFIRIGGGLIGICAALIWIAERGLGLKILPG